MHTVTSLLLLVVLAASQVSALHCAMGSVEGSSFLDGHPPTAAHGAAHGAQDHSPHHGHSADTPAEFGEAPGLPVDGHDHEDRSECTTLLACGGAAVPLAAIGAHVAAAPASAALLPGVRALHSALSPDDPPPPRSRA